jgi:transposase
MICNQGRLFGFGFTIVGMYVHVIPNRKSPPAILLREGYREGGKSKSRTIANISSWPPERIESLARALKGEFDGVGSVDPVADRIFGVLFVLKELADRIGLTRVLGKTRMGKLVLFMVLARIADQGSRLSAVRWAKDHCVAEILGLDKFNEDDLYGAMDWLAAEQDDFEKKLYLNYKRDKDPKNILVLYDVTSSYLEGQRNGYGEYGYDRDKKKGKKQIVIGLLTGPDGEPLSVKVFKGNTSDPSTVETQIETLKDRFGVKDIVFVGDRGMVKSKGKQALFKNGFKYITALTDPQVRKLLNRNVIQLDLFDTTVCEVNHGNVRLILRKNEAVSRKEANRREDKLNRLRELIAKRNEFVLNSKRADPEAGLRNLTKWVTRHKLTSFVQLPLDNNRIGLVIDDHAKSEAGSLDGCYVMETDVSADMMNAKTIDERYRSLQQVERDFRSLKNGFLEVRPVYVRKKVHTRAHIFIAMLALKIIRKAESLLREASTESTDKLRLSDALRIMSRLCFLRYSVKGMEFLRLPRPDTGQIAVCDALGIRPPQNNTSMHVSAETHSI